jgi:hypothetical protein
LSTEEESWGREKLWQGTGGVLLPFLGLGTMGGDQQWMVVNFKPVAFQWALREKGYTGGLRGARGIAAVGRLEFGGDATEVEDKMMSWAEWLGQIWI